MVAPSKEAVDKARLSNRVRIVASTLLWVLLYRYVGRRSTTRNVKPLQVVVATLLGRHVFINLGVFFGLTPPSPPSGLHPEYGNGIGMLTALDAGFILCSRIPWRPVRDVLSVLLSLPFIVMQDTAVQLVQRARLTGDIYSMRYLWNKGFDNPILAAITQARITTSMRRTMRIDVGRFLPAEFKHLADASCYLLFNGSEEELNNATSVLLYFHGGGFACMSPRHHEEYLGPWANQTRMPVLAIDYVKAPEHPYPAASLQCYALYRVMLETQGACIGIRSGAKINIVVGGDSAGGNLSVTTTLRALSDNVAPPHGLMLVYPVVALNFGSVSDVVSVDKRPIIASQLRHLQDPILPLSILLNVPGAYAPHMSKEELEADPFFLPFYQPDDMFARFPPTVIHVGNMDPLYDDSLILAKRLRESNPDRHVELIEMDGYSHGYMNMTATMPSGPRMLRAMGERIIHLAA